MTQPEEQKTPWVEGLTLQTTWGDVQDLPVVAANQFAIQVTAPKGDPGREIFLTVGHIAPPVLSGTREEQQAALVASQPWVIKPVIRLLLTEAGASQLAQLLQILAGHDEAEPK